MEGVLKLFAQKIVLLNQKVTMLSLQTIRQKLAWYLLNEYKRQKTLTINLESSKVSLAEKIGIPRPSFPGN
jgi:CRP-like cAMP-binding protein